MPQTTNTLSLAHDFIKTHLSKGDLAIDATMGRGNDTVLLCNLVGETGEVLAFDIQSEALESTKSILHKNNFTNRSTLILDSHSNMDLYAQKETVSAITFNLGYLPKGNHTISTKGSTSVIAIKKGLDLLKKDGVISLCIYYGGHSGFEEKDTVMDYLKTLDSQKYTVIVSDFYNRPNNPPIFVAITRDI